MEVAGEPGRDLALAIQLDAPLRRVPTNHEAVFLCRESDVVAPGHRGSLLVAVAAHIYTSRIAPQYPMGEARRSRPEPARPTRTRDHALERREARVAGLPPRRQGFCWGSSIGQAEGRHHRARADRAARTTGPPCGCPSKYVSQCVDARGTRASEPQKTRRQTAAESSMLPLMNLSFAAGSSEREHHALNLCKIHRIYRLSLPSYPTQRQALSVRATDTALPDHATNAGARRRRRLCKKECRGPALLSRSLTVLGLRLFALAFVKRSG